MLSTRILPDDEWEDLDSDHIPLLFPFLEKSKADILVVERDRQVVGGVTISNPTHLDGLWLDERNPGTRRALLKGLIGNMRDRYAISCASNPSISRMLERLGGVRMRQEFYTLDMCEVKKCLTGF